MPAKGVTIFKIIANIILSFNPSGKIQLAISPGMGEGNMRSNTLVVKKNYYWKWLKIFYRKKKIDRSKSFIDGILK
jgi:hypothetical protein